MCYGLLALQNVLWLVSPRFVKYRKYTIHSSEMCYGLLAHTSQFASRMFVLLSDLLQSLVSP